MIDAGILVLRLGLGVMFMGHGLQKAFGMFGGPGVAGFAQFLGTLGFVPAQLWAYVAAYTELICGICLVLGVATRISSCLLLVLISVAAFKVHLSKGFFLQSGGFEYTFIIAAVCIALMLLGPGKFGLSQKL